MEENTINSNNLYLPRISKVGRLSYNFTSRRGLPGRGPRIKIYKIEHEMEMPRSETITSSIGRPLEIPRVGGICWKGCEGLHERRNAHREPGIDAVTWELGGQETEKELVDWDIYVSSVKCNSKPIHHSL